MRRITTDPQTLIENLVIYEGSTPDYNEFWFWPFFWELSSRLREAGRIRIQEHFLGGRQISKSTTSAMDIGISMLQSNYRQLYVAPQESQATAFATARLDPILRSPKMYEALFTKNSKLIPRDRRGQRLRIRDETRSKIAVNGSYVNIAYSDGTDPSRLRGYSADKGTCDEAQEMKLGDVHHVMLYSLRSSDNPILRNVGTPLGEDELTESFNDSLKFMYHVTCQHCSLEQTLTDLRQIDVKKSRIVCKECGYPLEIFEHGRYVSENPTADRLGMHANMLMLPSIQNERSGTWEVIKESLSSKSKSDDEKAEEILGVPKKSGQSFITRELFLALPELPHGFRPESLDKIMTYAPNIADMIVMGIDWGGDASEGNEAGKREFEFINSHTAVCISGFSLDHQRGRVIQDILFEKVWPIEDPMKTLDEIKDIYRRLHTKLSGVAADYGGGYFPNPELYQHIRMLSNRCVFSKIQQLPTLAVPFHVASPDLIKVIKADAMTEYFRKLREKEFRYHRSHTPEEFITGGLIQKQVYDKRGTLRWKRKNKTSDDVFMAGMFSWLLAITLLGAEHEVLKNRAK